MTLAIRFLLIAVFFTSKLIAQECKVDKPSLEGTYTGECKKGKANGKGKAVGKDSYEGDFKGGLPDGQGTYTWSNGDSHTGKFVKGLREGKGTAIFKREHAPDSVVQGYWKKDVYAGVNENPYKIYFASKGITQSEVEYKREVFQQVTFSVTNTSGAATEVSGESPRMKVDDIQMIKGTYGRTLTNDDHVKKSETIVYDVTFPARMKLTIGSEQLDIEFFEPGSYKVDIRINQ